MKEYRTTTLDVSTELRRGEQLYKQQPGPRRQTKRVATDESRLGSSEQARTQPTRGVQEEWVLDEEDQGTVLEEDGCDDANAGGGRQPKEEMCCETEGVRNSGINARVRRVVFARSSSSRAEQVRVISIVWPSALVQQ